MRHLLFILLIICTGESSLAQNIGPAIVNTMGNTYTQAGITHEWSVGELALVETMINSEGSITNGLLQPILLSIVIASVPPILPTNILTANGDGKNDYWIIKDIEKYPDNEVTVFDRAGRIIFRAKNYQNNWTGNLSGLPLTEDTYYYIIKFKKDGKYELVKGFITILN